MVHIGPDARWTLWKNRRDGKRRICVAPFSAVVKDGINLEFQDRTSFKRDTLLGAWKRNWALLRKRSLAILIDAHFIEILITKSEQKTPYDRGFWDAIEAGMEVEDGDP